MKPDRPERTGEPIQPERIAERLFERIEARTGWIRSQTLIAVSATLVIVLVCCVSSTFAVAVQPPQSTATPSPTFVPLPTTTASDVLAEFRKTDTTIADVKPLKVPNATWAAMQGIQFTTKHDTKVAQLLLLSYDSDEKAGADAFKVRYDPQFGTWSVAQVSNVLLLAAPTSDVDVVNALVQRLKTLLVVPYRAYLQTATPSR